MDEVVSRYYVKHSQTRFFSLQQHQGSALLLDLNYNHNDIMIQALSVVGFSNCLQLFVVMYIVPTHHLK